MRSRPEGVTAEALAAELGVSAQSVRNYRAAGMPTLGRGRYDLEACRAWVRDNRPPVTAQGGRRRGAGRPAKVEAPTPAGGLKLSGLDEDDGKKDDKANLAEAELRYQLARAEKAEIEVAKTRGELLSRAECEAAWGELLAWLKTRLDQQAPERLTRQIVGALSLDAAAAKTVRDEVTRYMRATLEELAADPLELRQAMVA